MMIPVLIAVTGFACMLLFYQTYVLHDVRRARVAQGEDQELLQRRIQLLEQEMGALCSASVGTGEHVVKLEQQVRRITERQDQLELHAASDRPYRQANQLVTKGAGIEDVMDSCGLTRGEAELLVMMQRGSARAPRIP